MSTQYFVLREKKSGKFVQVESRKRVADITLASRFLDKKSAEQYKTELPAEIVAIEVNGSTGDVTEVKEDEPQRSD